MKKILLLSLIAFLIISIPGMQSCKEEENNKPDPPTGKITFNFEHAIDGETVEWDNMKYTNAAGNSYEVTNVQWFISDVTLNKADGGTDVIDAWEFYHYIDSDIPNSMTWDVTDKIPAGDYESISMTFGFKGGKNEPFMFVNYPESAMFWPLHLGGDSGGYHYMKLNGFWMDDLNRRSPFEFHLGVGQAQDVNGNRIKDKDGNFVFVQNWFEVELPQSAFSLTKNSKKEITIRMNIENWFKNPNTYDHDDFGADIMENQAAQKEAKENGIDVFTVTEIKDIQ